MKRSVSPTPRRARRAAFLLVFALLAARARAQHIGVIVDRCLPPDAESLTATAIGFPGPLCGSTHWTISGGTITAGLGTSTITFTSGPAGTPLVFYVTSRYVDLSPDAAQPSGCTPGASGRGRAQVDFADVPVGDIFYGDVCAIGRHAITAGCGGGDFCPDAFVRRDQMAALLLKAKLGESYLPPACSSVFADVPCPGPFTDWVEQLTAESITVGCGDGNYCPDRAVTRGQMAAFLLKSEHGADYAPPPCTGVFEDVSCLDPFAAWIEALHAEGITAGCQASPLLYCANAGVKRGQMATFLARTFQLQ